MSFAGPATTLVENLSRSALPPKLYKYHGNPKIDSSANDLIDGSSQDKSLLAAKIQKLHIFFSLLIPDMSHEERQLLDESLIQTYNKKGITHNNDSLCDPKDPSHYKEMPVLEDVYNILIENADTRRLANIMNRLVHGSASTFNQQTNVSLENKYTVLDISELTGDLLTVGMFVALDYVWDKAKEDRTAEKPSSLMRYGSLSVLCPTTSRQNLSLRFSRSSVATADLRSAPPRI